MLFSGNLQRQQTTRVTLRKVLLISLDRLLLHYQAVPSGKSSSSPRWLPKLADRPAETFLCVYVNGFIVWCGQSNMEVSSYAFILLPLHSCHESVSFACHGAMQMCHAATETAESCWFCFDTDIVAGKSLKVAAHRLHQGYA